MSVEHLEIEIKVNENDGVDRSRSTISGSIVLSPKENVTIDSMNVYLYLEIKGKMSPSKNKLQVKNLFSHSKQLSKNQKYEFPFSFVETSGIFSYEGINAAIHHKLEVGLDIDPDDYNKIKPGILSSLKKLVTNDTSLRAHRYIYFEDTSKRYNVETGEITLQRSFEFWLAAAFALVIAMVVFYFLPSFKDLYIAVGIVFSLLLGFIFQLIYLHFSQTEIVVQLTNNEDNSFNLNSIANSGVHRADLQFYYDIQEKVVDNSGSTSTTNTSVRYLSGFKTVGTSIVEKDLTFEFPKGINMPTISMNNFDITWTMYAKMKDTFGMEAIYKSEMHVVLV